jgi:hypothetical protein
LPEVRKRFGWDSGSDQFTDIDNAREFFELIAPQTKETSEAKLQSFSDVRKLKFIVGNTVAEEVLTDPRKSLADALSAVTQHRPPPAEQKQAFSEFLVNALATVKKMTREELKALTSQDKKTIRALMTELKEIASK